MHCPMWPYHLKTSLSKLFLGKVMDNGHYLVGNTVQYSCHEGYVLIGEPIIRCTETGLWSHAPPFCKFNHATDVKIR